MNEELARKYLFGSRTWWPAGNATSPWREKGNCSPVHLLRTILADGGREPAGERPSPQARSAPAFPSPLVMETFPFDGSRSSTRNASSRSTTPSSTSRRTRNIIWIGPTGCGKTGPRHELPHRRHQPGPHGTLRPLPRARQRALLLRGGSLRGEGDQALPRLRVPPGRRARLRGNGAGPGGPLLHADAHGATRSARPSSPRTSVSAMALVPQERPPGGRLDRPLTETSHVFNMKGCRSLSPKLDEMTEAHELPGSARGPTACAPSRWKPSSLLRERRVTPPTRRSGIPAEG